MFFVTGTNWQLGRAAAHPGQPLPRRVAGRSTTRCCAGSPSPDERDRVSSRGWALGYLGGGLLLAAEPRAGHAARPRRALRGRRGPGQHAVGGPVVGRRSPSSPCSACATSAAPRRPRWTSARAWSAAACASSVRTFAELRAYPQTLLFLLAYLFYNDGIQTVITSSSLYGAEQLGFGQSQLIITVLLVQFVGFGGALLFGRLARSRRRVAGGPRQPRPVAARRGRSPSSCRPARSWPFLALAVLIGIVLGGTQALCRSLFSQLVPRGREAEFFSLYQAMERGTSWLGTLRLRPGPPAHRLLPLGDHRPDGLLPRRRRPAVAGAHARGHPRRREHRPGRRLSTCPRPLAERRTGRPRASV